MNIDSRVYISEEITNKERRLVERVLKNYDLSVINIQKARSAYKVETEQGLICLKRMNHGIRKAINGSTLVEELYEKGFKSTPAYLKTKDGKLYIKSKNMIFYVTEWIDGKETSFSNIEEAKNCISLLGKFHIAVMNIDVKKFKLTNNLKNWPQIFNDSILDLEKNKKIIENKRIKNEFDKKYYEYIDSYIKRIRIALNILNKSNYYNLSREALNNKTICHNSFYYQNILKKNDEYYIIDLDSIIIDLHINDLGKIIRRLMYKGEYKWDFYKASILIEAYNTENKLCKDEIEAMLALIIFPHKFWKLGRKRYIKHKNWPENKYMHKLNRIIGYFEAEEKFLDMYINYIEEYV